MSEDIFADRKQVENSVRLALLEVQYYINAAISNGLYPDGLPINLYNVKQVTDYSVGVLANTEDSPNEPVENEDGNQDN